MALQASAYQTTHPSFIEPEILLQYSQASGFVDTLADSQLRTRLGEDDLLVYMKQLNLRTRIVAGQASSNELPGVDIAASMLATPSYRYQVRAGYDHHDTAAAGHWGFSLTEAYRLGMRQACFTLARDAALFGMNPQNGEGLLNAPGATALNLPNDPNGNSTLRTYDNGAFAFLIAQQIGAIKARTLQLGLGQHFCILGPQRDLVLFEYNVVQLTQYQRTGAGTASSAGTIKEILMANGDNLVWAYDDSLIGAGAGGTDAIIIVMPELIKPAGKPPVNLNEFAKLLPGAAVNTTQYCDMPAPKEIISPMAGGATDVLMEWRTTSGWAVRPQSLTILSATY